MIATIALCALVARGTLEFSHPIDSGEVVIKALGQEVGLDLRASGELIDDRIFVRLRDTDWESAKPMLAEGLAATWSQKGDVHYLARPTATKPAASKRQQIVAAIKKWQGVIEIEPSFDQEVLTDRLMDLPSDQRDPGYNRISNVFADGSDFYRFDVTKSKGQYFVPVARALVRILKLINPEQIADIAESNARLASPRPFARDLPLPPQAARVFRLFVEEQETLRQAIEIAGVGHPLLSGGYFDRPAPDPSEIVVKVFVNERDIRLVLARLDRNVAETLGYARFAFEPLSVPPIAERPPALPKIEVALTLAADELALGRYYASHQFETMGEATPKSWASDLRRGRSLATNPVENERLELICGPVLRQMSDAINVSVIALLSDLTYRNPAWLVSTENGLATVGHALQEMIGYDWGAWYTGLERNGYWLLRPVDLQLHELGRYDRKTYRDAISLVSRSRWFDLGFWRFALSRVDGADQLQNLAYETQRYFEGGPGYPSYQALVLLTSLTKSELEVAKTGQLYKALASLPKTIQGTLTKSAVDWQLLSQPLKYDSFGDPIYPDTGDSRSEWRYQIVDGLVAFRDGIPADATVQINYLREPIYHPRMIDEGDMGEMSLSNRAFSMMPARQIAPYLVDIEESNEQAQQWTKAWDFDQTYVSYTDVIRITVDWSGLGYSVHEFAISIEPADFDRGPISALSAYALDFLKRAIAKTKADNERRRQKAKDGGGR